MRFIVLGIIIGLIFGCEDKKSAVLPKQKFTENITKTNIKKDSSKVQQRKYPKLTDANAMDFFLEYEKKHPENKVRITTDFGTIDIQLFEKTKFHRANFIFLTQQKYFDNTQFYRVVPNFIIQGGSSDENEIFEKRKQIGHYLLPKDTNRGYKHTYGAVSMPSSAIDNPHKMASPYQFFIVQNKNGAYHLDNNYTVFGKVIRGMDVVNTIANQKTDDSEWPLHNIYIKRVELLN